MDERRIVTAAEEFMAFKDSLPTRAERRRYALLQAAIGLYSHAESRAAEMAKVGGHTAFLRADVRRIAAAEAESMLSEIESREVKP